MKTSVKAARIAPPVAISTSVPVSFSFSQQVPVSFSVPLPVPATQRGLDAVADLGMDPTGQADASPILQAYLDSLSAAPDLELHFPPGRYYLKSGVVTNAARVKLIGDGQVSNIAEGAVTLFSDQPLAQMLWFHTPQQASNLQSVWLQHLQFSDSSPGRNQVNAAVRITNQANFCFFDVGGRNLVARRYATGAVSVANGQKTVTASGGAAWSPALVPGFIMLGGYPYEIASVPTATSLTLAIAYQGASLAGAAYVVSSGGILFWAEPGLGFTQYGTVEYLKAHTVSCPVFMSAGTGSTGTSRIKFLSGYVNGASLPDSVGAYLGPFSDTVRWALAANSFAFGVVIASGHHHDISSADFENAGSPPPVTGSPATGYAACKGVLVMGDSASNTWGNRIVNNEFRQVGTAIEMAGNPGSAPTQSKIAFNVYRSNTANYVPGNATLTSGEVDGVFHGVKFTA